MEKLSTSNGNTLSLFKNRPLENYVKVRKSQECDMELVRKILANGISLHSGSFWSGEESRQDWLQRTHGSSARFVCEETRVAYVGNIVVGAYALAGLVSIAEEARADVPASFRFFAINPDFYSHSLVALLLNDSLRISRRWGVEYLSAELFSAGNPLIPIFEKFGFEREFSERAEEALLHLGSRTYAMSINEYSEKTLLAK